MDVHYLFPNGGSTTHRSHSIAPYCCEHREDITTESSMVSEWTGSTYTMNVSRLIKFDVDSVMTSSSDDSDVSVRIVNFPQDDGGSTDTERRPMVRCEVRLPNVPDYLETLEREIPPPPPSDRDLDPISGTNKLKPSDQGDDFIR